MTDTSVAGNTSAALTAMKLPQLQALASELGVAGVSKMKKSDLVAAINNGGVATPRRPATSKPTDAAARVVRGPRDVATARSAQTTVEASRLGEASAADRGDAEPRRVRRVRRRARTPRQGSRRDRGDRRPAASDTRASATRRRNQPQSAWQPQPGTSNEPQPRRQRPRPRRASDNRRPADSRRNNSADNDADRDDDDRSGRRRGAAAVAVAGAATDQQGGHVPMESFDEDDVRDDEELTPVGGILDVLDNYGFIRTTGYLPGKTDVYVSHEPGAQVRHAQGRRRHRRRPPAPPGRARPAPEVQRARARRHGQRHDRRKRRRTAPIFGDLTPLYPQARLHLETDSRNLTNRVIDLVAPIGKGQRGLIVSPPKAGKTLVLQSIANAITVNNPEVHLMVVLVDERPEEVTDMQRTVKGEVIASTFDRPAEDHTTVAELAIERAKRLVEMGQDVVVLLDSITRLGRAYNLAAPASGRILSGGVDSSALYPPKRFFGAARNIEHGGSLTILATALVETGSKMDEVIFEEFKGTGNMELKLSRQLADRRIFPAVDVNASGTRREEILISPEELKVNWKLRRVLTGLEQQQAIELLLGRLKENKTNAEFLMQVAKTTPGGRKTKSSPRALATGARCHGWRRAPVRSACIRTSALAGVECRI